MRREVPTDEQILNTMTIVYRRANRMKDMSAAFAAASAAHPRDEGLLRGVFVSYVRQVSTVLLFDQSIMFNIAWLHKWLHCQKGYMLACMSHISAYQAAALARC